MYIYIYIHTHLYMHTHILSAPYSTSDVTRHEESPECSVCLDDLQIGATVPWQPGGESGDSAIH